MIWILKIFYHYQKRFASFFSLSNMQPDFASLPLPLVDYSYVHDIDTGMKYHENKITYRKVQKANDKLCKEYGLSITLNKMDLLLLELPLFCLDSSNLKEIPLSILFQVSYLLLFFRLSYM